ncbi:MAG TPA: hypothetical protein VGG98_09505 [Solirubrobacteraceae bacterium]|jgi:hypothetical protein
MVLTAATLALGPAWTSADADPASDYLLAAPVFYPYQPPTSPALRHVLEGALSRLQARGLGLKVAIIADPTDLGGVTNLWNMPQRYADFVVREISFNAPQPLLVVMPGGFGTSHVGSTGALKDVVVDGTHGTNGLARSAIGAVVRLAQAAGKPIPAPAIPRVISTSGRTAGGTSPLLTFGAPVLLVALAAGLATLLRRRTRLDRHGP